MSDPVLNRYTSDSWSLELSAESSPLSRWTRKPVVKDEHFRLSLLGFETGSAPISWLEGDRPLLDSLHQAVESYVQSNLQKPTQQPGRAPSDDGMALLEPETNVVPMVPAAGSSPGSGVNAHNPFKLESDRRVGHRLHYTQAGTQARSLKLSTLQLADLLEVLDRWQGESMALPPEEAKTTIAAVARPDFVIPTWGRVAASAAIALGAATGGVYLLNSQPVSQTASVSGDALESDAAADEFGAFPQVSSNPSGQLPNAPVAGSQQFSAPFLKQNPGQRFGDISEDSLPGLESGEVASADATLPDAASAASSSIDLDGIDTSSISSADFLPPALPEANLGLPSSNFDVTPLPDTTIASASGASAAPIAPEVATAPAPSLSVPNSSFADAQAELAAAEADLKAQQAQIAAQDAEAAEAIANSNDVTTLTPADLGISEPLSGSESPEPSLSESPNVAQTSGNDVAFSGGTSGAASEAPATDAAADTLGPAQSAANTAARAGSAASSEATAAKPAAAPVARAKPTGASQSAAVKNYFESRWSPPEELSQPLQYQLILSNEGSIEKMNPLSPAATQYSQEAGIPSVGDPFIPSSTDIQDATLVLTLGADGSVNVSVEKVTPKP